MNCYFDDESQKIIINAKKEMYALKHPYVGTEHLFLAVLKDDELDITKFLKKYNITYELFYNELVKTIGLGSKTNEWFLFTPMLNSVINNAHLYSSNTLITPTSLIISLFHEGEGIANRILLSLKVDVGYLYEKLVDEDELAIKMNSFNN